MLAMKDISTCFKTWGKEKLSSDRFFKKKKHFKYVLWLNDRQNSELLKVGLPAKSGVSGALMIIVPNVMGITLW